MKRAKWLLLGLVIPLLMAATGGFPFFPTFGGVHINNRGLASFNQLALDTPTAGTVSNYLSFNTAGVNKAVILNERSAGGNCSGDAVDDLCIRAISGKLYGSDSTQGQGQIAIMRSGSFTGTITGCTTSPTVTVLYTVIGTTSAGMVSMRWGTNGCTANANTFNLSGVPAILRPATTNPSFIAVDGCSFLDNAVAQCGKVSAFPDTLGNIEFWFSGNQATWTASGSRSLGQANITYVMQ